MAKSASTVQTHRVWKRLSKIIDVRGCFWHMHSCGRCRIPATRRDYWVAKLQRNKDRDRRTRRTLSRLGWKVLTVWECQTINGVALAERLQAFLDGGARKR